MIRGRLITAGRGGFTLMEAIAAILLLAILVPPSVAMLRDATTARAQSLDITRATWLAHAVLEHVIADASSPNLGMSALSTADYLSHATSGLYARLTPVSSVYAPALTYTVTIGPLTSADGTTTGDAARDVFRTITVTVNWTSRTGEQSFDMSAVVTDLRPE